MATPTNADGQIVVLPRQAGAPAGSVLTFGVINPDPGQWKVSLFGQSDAADFQFMASTIPTTGGQEMTAVMQELLTYGVESNARFSWACTSCQVAAYGLALAITVAVAGASTAILTAESAVVVGTAGFLGITAPAALALVAGLITGGTVTVDFVLTNLCNWLGAC